MSLRFYYIVIFSAWQRLLLKTGEISHHLLVKRLVRSRNICYFKLLSQFSCFLQQTNAFRTVKICLESKTNKQTNKQKRQKIGPRAHQNWLRIRIIRTSLSNKRPFHKVNGRSRLRNILDPLSLYQFYQLIDTCNCI